MKIIIFLFLILITNVAYTQDYIEIPTNDAHWKVSMTASACSGGDCGYHEFITSGDTIINSTTYTKINLYGSIHGGYYGCIRNNVEEKKVYTIRPNKTTEEILYDFALKVGDTTHVNGDTASVTSIDSVFIDNNYRYIYNLSSLLSEFGFGDFWEFLDYSLIEGVGSSNGLFFGPGYIGVNALFYDLICHSINSESVFPVGASDCNSLLTISNTSKSSFKVSVYPNPANHVLTVSTNQKKILYEIIGMDGTIKLKGTSEKEINILNLQSGLYFLRLYDSTNKVLIKNTKFVKY